MQFGSTFLNVADEFDGLIISGASTRWLISNWQPLALFSDVEFVVCDVDFSVI